MVTESRTVKEIQQGNYCPNCAIECKFFAIGADDCICATEIGRLYATVFPEHLDRVMQFEARQ